MRQRSSRVAALASLALAMTVVAGLGAGGAADAAKNKAKKKAAGKVRTFQGITQQAIPDRPPDADSFVGLLDSTIGVGKAMKGKLAADVDVSIRVTHPDLSDLDFYLIAPNGAKVFLAGNHDGIGNAATGYGAGAADCNGEMTTFSDETPNFLSDSTTGTIIEPGQIVSPWASTVQPEGFPLNVVDGSRARGPWTLRVLDFGSGDTGVLHCWKVRIKPRNR